MTTKFYRDNDGKYLGGFDGALPPQGAVEVPVAPADGRMIWNSGGEVWEMPSAITAEQNRVAGIADDALTAALITQMKTATADQIKAYVDTNVTNLAEARAMLKRVILVLARMAKVLNGSL